MDSKNFPNHQVSQKFLHLILKIICVKLGDTSLDFYNQKLTAEQLKIVQEFDLGLQRVQFIDQVLALLDCFILDDYSELAYLEQVVQTEHERAVIIGAPLKSIIYKFKRYYADINVIKKKLEAQ